jgi:hypothetical protein
MNSPNRNNIFFLQKAKASLISLLSQLIVVFTIFLIMLVLSGGFPSPAAILLAVSISGVSVFLLELKRLVRERDLTRDSISSASATIDIREEDRSTPPKINLTIVNQFFPPDYAATGMLIEELAQSLKDYGEIEVLTSMPSYQFARGDVPARDREDSLIVRRFHAAKHLPQGIRNKAVAGAIFFIRIALYLFRYADSNRLILLTTAPPFLPLLGYLLSRVREIRYVCLLYDLYPEILVELDVFKKKNRATKFKGFCYIKLGKC